MISTGCSTRSYTATWGACCGPAVRTLPGCVRQAAPDASTQSCDPGHSQDPGRHDPVHYRLPRLPDRSLPPPGDLGLNRPAARSDGCGYRRGNFPRRAPLYLGAVLYRRSGTHPLHDTRERSRSVHREAHGGGAGWRGVCGIDAGARVALQRHPAGHRRIVRTPVFAGVLSLWATARAGRENHNLSLTRPTYRINRLGLK